MSSYLLDITLGVHLTAPGQSAVSGSFGPDDPTLGNLPLASIGPMSGAQGSWLLEWTDADVQGIHTSLKTPDSAPAGPHSRVRADVVHDVFVVCHFVPKMAP